MVVMQMRIKKIVLAKMGTSMQIYLSWIVMALHAAVILCAIFLVVTRKLGYQNLVVGLFGLSLIVAWLRDWAGGLPIGFDMSVGAGLALIIAAWFDSAEKRKSK